MSFDLSRVLPEQLGESDLEACSVYEGDLFPSSLQECTEGSFDLSRVLPEKLGE